MTVYASWNGSTEMAHWRVSAGDEADALAVLKTVATEGFETTVRMTGRPRFVSVTALDAAKRPIGASPVVRVRT